MTKLRSLLLGAINRRLESVLRLALRILSAATSTQVGRLLTARCDRVRTPELEVDCLGRTLSNPIGLAAGFDKDCLVGGAFSIFGFGFVEVGTVLCQPQGGHPKPRVFVAPHRRALINRMGSPSAGLAIVKPRVERRSSYSDAPLAVNIGVSQDASLADMISQLGSAAQGLSSSAWYICVNVSSPNTAGLRLLDRAELLRVVMKEVLDAVDRARGGLTDFRRTPVFVKISPDLSSSEITQVARLTLDIGFDGIVATNTTRGVHGPVGVASDERGGISGQPLKERSLEVLRLLHHETRGKVVLISVGGIESADDVWDRISAGATLVQGYTGFVFGGPLWVWRLRRDLRDKVRRAGYRSIQDAVGASE